MLNYILLMALLSVDHFDIGIQKMSEGTYIILKIRPHLHNSFKTINSVYVIGTFSFLFNFFFGLSH